MGYSEQWKTHAIGVFTGLTKTTLLPLQQHRTAKTSDTMTMINTTPRTDRAAVMAMMN